MSQEEWDALANGEDYLRHCPDFDSGDEAPEEAEIWSFVFTGVDAGE